MPSVTKSEQEATRTAIGKSEDDNFLKNFLSGDQCLQGVWISSLHLTVL